MRAVTLATLLGFIAVPAVVLAINETDVSEVTISKTGVASIKNAKVMQFAGTTVYLRLTWGDAFLRVVAKTSPTTKITRRYGEPMTLKEVREGDRVDVEGILDSRSNSFILEASSIIDVSDHRSQKNVSGIVTSVLSDGTGFYMDSKEFGLVRVIVNSSTSIKKGNRYLGLDHVYTGDKVINAEGVVDMKEKTFSAYKMEIHLDLSQFKPKNYQGTLRSLSSESLPLEAIISVEGKEYKVIVPTGTPIINSKRKPVSLSRFETGDTLRFYGALRETDEPIIDAELVRNMDL